MPVSQGLRECAEYEGEGCKGGCRFWLIDEAYEVKNKTEFF